MVANTLRSGKIAATTDSITLNAKFSSFAEFERIFERWKTKNNYMFRIASSEMMKDKGKPSALFKYRYVVFHCIHYGAPRIRGFGSRLRQNYLPCGCKASIRLAYIAAEKAMIITKLDGEHTGHGGGAHPIDNHHDAAKAQIIAKTAHRIAISRRVLLANGDADDLKNGTLKLPPFDEIYETQKTYVETLIAAQKEGMNQLQKMRAEKGIKEPFKPPPLNHSTLEYFMSLDTKGEEERRSWNDDNDTTDTD